MDDLWTPTKTGERLERPTTRKIEGGSIFDDELGTEEAAAKTYAHSVQELLTHLNQRPDHVVYVGSDEERTKMRQVFNWWKKEGALLHNPNIRIDYGVAEGAIRVGEER
jgi:hypothetical protein